MLSLLRADPANRAAAYVKNSDGDEERALVEVDSRCLPKRWLAWLPEEGTAHDLLEAPMTPIARPTARPAHHNLLGHYPFNGSCFPLD